MKTTYQVITSHGEQTFRTLREARAVAEANGNANIWKDNGSGTVDLVK